MTHTLVLGIGNTLLSDEGIGIHVIDYLRRQHPAPEGVTYLDGGTLSFTLAGEIEDSVNLIVVDAAQVGDQPGTVVCMAGTRMDQFLGAAKRSVHEVGLLDLLDIARLTDTLPANRALVGIQPDIIDWGEQPTAAVSSAIPIAASHINNLIAKWHQTDSMDQQNLGEALNPVENNPKVESGSYHTSNVQPLLHEIRHALCNLLDTGQTTTIDLRGLPLAPGEQKQLLKFLGKGEISVQMNALGKSEIIETGFPGVWLIMHHNTNKEIMGKFIEITRMPAILEAQTADMEDSLASLQVKLAEL